MERFKYNDGDLIGPHHILMIQRTYKDSNNKWRGNFKCPYCNNIFESRINSIQSGLVQSCGCWNKHQAKQHCSSIGKKYGGQKKKDLTGQRFNYLIVLYSVGKTQANKIVWCCQCKCGKETFATTGDLISGKKTSCGCRTESLGEEKIRLILQKLNIIYIQQKTFKNCRNPKTDCLLKFDFYLPEYNCCIEYDGIQHFKEGTGWANDLKNLQYRDNIKNQYCKNNNIRLIRVPYTDFNLLNEEYLLNKIKEN